jgi:hypothetical protein
MPEQMVRLIAPPGSDECNFGTVRYRVGDDGTVTVPAEVAKDLVHGAGFSRALMQPDEATDKVAAAFSGDPQV